MYTGTTTKDICDVFGDTYTWHVHWQSWDSNILFRL